MCFFIRSITSDSAIFDFDRHDTLHRKYGRLVENSIMRATVLRIRNAQKFIYLENQVCALLVISKMIFCPFF